MLDWDPVVAVIVESIIWDFVMLRMEFTYKGKQTFLKGITAAKR